MSSYADICRDIFADESDISFENNTWTVPPMFGLDKPLTGIPRKDMALAIYRAIWASWDLGNNAYQDGC